MRTRTEKATRRQTREHNRRLVLRHIFDAQDGISRADVARLTRLTKATVSDLVAELMRDGLVEEAGIGEASSAGGKPPLLLRVVDGAREVFAVDVSGDHFRAAALDLRGRVLREQVADAEDLTGEAALARLDALLDALYAERQAPVLGVGISSPGLVDTENGTVCRAVNLQWQDVPLRERLQRRFGVPVYVANDSHLTALAEYTFGMGSPDANVVVVKVGPGIGSGLVLNGQLFYGDGFSAGEIGHLVVADDGVLCSCGNRGCLETVASTRALFANVRHWLTVHPDSPAATLLTPPLSCARIADALAVDARLGDVVDETAHWLGRALAAVVGVLNVRYVRLTGPVRVFGDRFIDAVQAALHRSVLPELAAQCEVAFGALGDEAPLLGASAYVLSRELGLR